MSDHIGGWRHGLTAVRWGILYGLPCCGPQFPSSDGMGELHINIQRCFREWVPGRRSSYWNLSMVRWAILIFAAMTNSAYAGPGGAASSPDHFATPTNAVF